ncbi:MAG TPA: DUF3971 domain-containing protein, partial [Rhodospirillales bacterium]|nr:DUF3971 domain-containing protein [Rhodospirillales bacterium]
MHLFVRLVAGTVAIAVVLAALLSMRLAAGPLSLGGLAPSVARILERVTPYQFEIGDLGILWRDWQQGLLVQLDDVRVTSGDGAELVRVDDVAIGFSAQAMARGVIAPTSIEARAAEITLGPRLLAAAAGGGGGGGGGGLDDLLGGLRGPPRVAHPLSFLQTVSVQDVAVRIAEPADSNAVIRGDWRLRVERAELARDDAHRLAGDAALTIARGDEQAQLSISLAPTAAGSGLSLRLNATGLRPAAFADAAPVLAPLVTVDVALQGSAGLEIDAEGRLGSATIDLSGNGGALVADGPLARAASIASPPQRLGVRTLSLRGSFDPTADNLAVDTLAVAFVPGTAFTVPAPVDFRIPLAGITASGSYEGGRAKLAPSTLDLDGLKLSLTGSAENLEASPSGTLSLAATDVRVDDFPRYWPPKLAPGAWRWCTEQLRDGIVPRLDARFDFATRNGATEVTALDARFNVEGLTVDYLPPMPPVRGASGTAIANLTSLRIDIDGGEAAGMAVRDGLVVFPDLDRDPPSIDIDIVVAGPVRAAMTLISSPPLEYDERIGIAPAQTSGETTTRLILRFPLLADLDADAIDIDADVALRNLGIADVAPGIDVSNGQIRMKIDNLGLRTEGRLSVGGV